MKDLDPKSLIIGFLTASVVALVVALIQPKEETKVSEVGRYIPFPKSERSLSSAILDTKTGIYYVVSDAVWHTFEIIDGGYKKTK